MTERRQVLTLALLAAVIVCWGFLNPRTSTPSVVHARARKASMEESAPRHSPKGPVSDEATSPEVPSTGSEENNPPEQPPGPVAPLPRSAALAARERVHVQAQGTVTAGADVAGESDGPQVMPVTALENLRSAFHQYAARFGGNPVGDNAEIAAALTGQNVRQQVFVTSDDGVRTDRQGRLVDNWGTPYFFHQLSRTETEIRSAGPDKRMWTSDDLVMK